MFREGIMIMIMIMMIAWGSGPGHGQGQHIIIMHYYGPGQHITIMYYYRTAHNSYFKGSTCYKLHYPGHADPAPADLSCHTGQQTKSYFSDSVAAIRTKTWAGQNAQIVALADDVSARVMIDNLVTLAQITNKAYALEI
jgi:hypothetical protein